MIRVTIFEDYTDMREILGTLVSTSEDLFLTGAHPNAMDIIKVVQKEKPDVILMDIKMPNLNGVETTKIIIEQYPDIKVVMLSSFYTDIFIAKMFEIGAVCYLSKNANPIEIISAINRVLENGFFYNDFEMNFLANKTPKNKDNNNIDDLSKRELEVLHYICKQFSSSEIAQKIDISPRTVDGHRNKLLEKTKTKNVVGLVVYAIQHNLFSPEIDF